MNTAQAATAALRHRKLAAAAVLLALGPALYLAGCWAAALADGERLTRVVCFNPTATDHFTPVRITIATAMAVGAILVIVVTPWTLGMLAFRRTASKRATAGAWSLAANSLALVVVCLVLRNTVGIGRVSFFVAWLAWTGVLLWTAGGGIAAAGEIRTFWRRWGLGLLIGVATVTLGIVLFHQEHFVQCFNGDGIETFELARSLRHHFLPYWEMEWAGRFGTDVTNPSLINSYWTCALQSLLGEGELATRLPYWIWWLGIFAVGLQMVQGENAEAFRPAAIPLALLMFLAGVWYTFFTGWYPYMADPANPGVTDALFTLFLLLALECLRQKDLGGWVVMIALSSLVLYAGLVMFVLTSVAGLIWQPVPRRQMLGAVLKGTGVLAGLALFYVTWGWLDGSLSGWWPTVYTEYVDLYIRPVPRVHSAMLYAGYFLLACGGVPAIGLVLPLRKNIPDNRSPSEVGWERTMATATLLYLLIILGASIKTLHYLGPLMPIPLILWLRADRRRGHGKRTNWVVTTSAAVSLLICVGITWPKSRHVFTLNRELGAITTFQTDSHEEACRWLRAAKVTMTLYKDRQFGWYVGQHTWLHYSELAAHPASLRPLLVTDADPPSDEYQLVFRWEKQFKLYCRDPERLRWAKEQRPPSGLQRSPRILDPIAIGPFRRPAE